MGFNQYLPAWILLFLAASGPVYCLLEESGIEGKSVNLTVKLNLPTQRELQWRFGTNSIIATAQLNNPPLYYGSYRGRCHLYDNTTLQLDNLTPADKGEYTLFVTNVDTGIQQNGSISLIVLSPLTPPTLKVNISTTNGNAYPVNDTNVALHCDAGGQNVVTYTFYQDGVTACSQPHVTCNKDFLYFQPIMMSDSGIYTCKIENPISSNTSQLLNLKVIARVSEVTLSSNASSGLLWAGKDSVNLTCSALGTNVTFSWQLDRAPLPPNPRYHLMNSNSSLIISPVERTDSGSFTCIGSNSLNIENSSLTLNLAWSPENPIQCKASQTNENVTLQCSWTGGRPPANVTMAFQNTSNETLSDTVSRAVAKTIVKQNDSLFCNGTQFGQLASCVLSLDSPRGEANNANSTVVEGQSAIMSVNLTSKKNRADSPQILPANFTWLSPNNQNLANGGNYKINSDDYWSKLEIILPKVSDNGMYKCNATNFMGHSTFTFELRVKKDSEVKIGPQLSPGAIAGIVIGSLAGVALIATAVFFIVKSTKKKQKKKSSGNSQMNMAAVAEKNQENEEYVKYADLRFKNANPTNKAASQQVPETEYSTVKR